VRWLAKRVISVGDFGFGSCCRSFTVAANAYGDCEFQAPNQNLRAERLTAEFKGPGMLVGDWPWASVSCLAIATGEGDLLRMVCSSLTDGGTVIVAVTMPFGGAPSTWYFARGFDLRHRGL